MFNLGPLACTINAVMVDMWSKHFVLTKSMIKMECNSLIPNVVLMTASHIDWFTDHIVKDPAIKKCFYADKLIKDAIGKLMESNLDMCLLERKGHM